MADDNEPCIDCGTPMMETWTCIGCDKVARAQVNGYVVVPEPLFKELLDAAAEACTLRDMFSFARLFDARAAVVEAVGPTKEQQK